MISLIASLPVEDVNEAINESLGALSSGADLVEFRLDYLSRIRISDVERILTHIPAGKCIFTVRSRAEGGVHQHENWVEVLRYALSKGAKIDVESERFDQLNLAKSPEMIISRHGDITQLERMKQDVEIYRGIEIKGSVRVDSMRELSDLVAFARHLNSRETKFTLMGTGRLGNFSRYILPLFGSRCVYVHTGRPTADGQPLLSEYRRIFDSISCSDIEGLLCLLGKNIGYTLSPVMQNAALKRCRIPWAYLPLDIDEEMLSSIRDEFPLPVKGFNVTTPYKEKIFPFLESLSRECEDIGAVNTITVHDGIFCGHNTDAPAFKDVLMQKLNTRGIKTLSGLRALVIGCGGAARAALYVLKEGGAETYLINRTRAKAESLGREFGCVMSGGLNLADALSGKADIIVNCTPISADGVSPVSRGSLLPKHIVMDMVYSPFKTLLIKDAALQGATVIEGIHMLAHQASRAFKLWTGKDIAPEFMLEACMKILFSTP